MDPPRPVFHGLWLGQLISNFGTQCSLYGIGLWSFERRGLLLDFGLLALQLLVHGRPDPERRAGANGLFASGGRWPGAQRGTLPGQLAGGQGWVGRGAAGLDAGPEPCGPAGARRHARPPGAAVFLGIDRQGWIMVFAALASAIELQAGSQRSTRSASYWCDRLAGWIAAHSWAMNRS